MRWGNPQAPQGGRTMADLGYFTAKRYMHVFMNMNTQGQQGQPGKAREV